jgi:hypothetical protein
MTVKIDVTEPNVFPAVRASTSTTRVGTQR